MRRAAENISLGYIAAILVATGCTERLELPTRAAATDAGREGGRSDGPERDTGGQAVGCADPLPLLPFRKIDLVFVLGRNNSMSRNFGSASRIQAATDAIVGGLQQFPSAIRYGYVDFPGDSSVSCDQGSGCCANPTTGLKSTLNHAGAIQNALSVCNFGGSTGCVSQMDVRPIADALVLAAGFLQGSDDRSIFLLTDGEPSCSNESSATSCSDAQSEIDWLNAQMDRNTGVKLYVFTLGQPADTVPCLRTLANRTNTTLVASDSPAKLGQDLRAALADVAASYCSFDLKTPISQDNIGIVQLSINGRSIPYEPLDGWTFQSGSLSKIDLHGKSCTLMQTATMPDVHVQICR